MAFHDTESPSQIITAGYSILLSPTYSVPVLYICLHGILPNELKGIEVAYQYLVPESSHQELSKIGVVGGLSMTVSEGFQTCNRTLTELEPPRHRYTVLFHPSMQNSTSHGRVDWLKEDLAHRVFAIVDRIGRRMCRLVSA